MNYIRTEIILAAWKDGTPETRYSALANFNFPIIAKHGSEVGATAVNGSTAEEAIRKLMDSDSVQRYLASIEAQLRMENSSMSKEAAVAAEQPVGDLKLSDIKEAHEAGAVVAATTAEGAISAEDKLAQVFAGMSTEKRVLVERLVGLHKGLKNLRSVAYTFLAKEGVGTRLEAEIHTFLESTMDYTDLMKVLGAMLTGKAKLADDPDKTAE